jgi:hypothetical protein
MYRNTSLGVKSYCPLGIRTLMIVSNILIICKLFFKRPDKLDTSSKSKRWECKSLNTASPRSKGFWLPGGCRPNGSNHIPFHQECKTPSAKKGHVCLSFQALWGGMSLSSSCCSSVAKRSWIARGKRIPRRPRTYSCYFGPTQHEDVRNVEQLWNSHEWERSW